jgi:uncharacterized protein YndB with AHSA1/START domain
MTNLDERSGKTAPALRLSRTFHASRAAVFKAWCSAEGVKGWFCPDGFTVPKARVDPKVGGPFEVCMRGSDGAEHWARGRFLVVEPNERLVIEMDVEGVDGRVAFMARTVATFAHIPGGTRLTIEQTYDIHDPSAVPMIGGAEVGWTQTLARLDADLLRQERERPSSGPATHDTFHLERTYPASRARVWAALTDLEAKSRWFVGPPGEWTLVERAMDVRAGGRERLIGRGGAGSLTRFEALYFDVVEAARLVYAYEMFLDERKISVSLATMELSDAPGGTRLRVTEQGAFLDGYDDAGSREFGTSDLLDSLGRWLQT